MRQVQSILASFCAFLMFTGILPAQQATQQPDQPKITVPETNKEQTPRIEGDQPHWYSSMTRPYEARVIPPVNLSNKGRLESLLRDGKLYLSLDDAVALALENNIDIEVERYIFPMAQADLLRAQAGASTNGFSTSTTGGTTGLAAVSAPSFIGSFTGGQGGNTTGFDPTINGTIQWGHITQPQQNTITTGTTALVSRNQTYNFNIAENFITGGSATLSFNNTNSAQNAYLNLFNPVTTSYLDLTVSQPLLQGFGIAINNRPIRIAKNNIHAADIVFKQQVMVTVQTVVQAYWNLVSANEQVDVNRKALVLAQKLYEDNKKQVEIGTLAPIEIVRAEAQVATSEQALVTSETTVLQQETILKNVLSRNGLSSPSVASARIEATDHIKIPDIEKIRPIQDLVVEALDSRPELEQSRIQLENQKIAITGTKNLLMPTLSAFADLRNSGLSGDPNTIVNPGTGLPYASGQNPFFIGGYGNVLGQIFSRNFPNYSIGLTLSIPLRNRAAQANYATQVTSLRQNELTVQRLINQIHVDVQNALIAVQQARAQYSASVKSRILQEQTLDAEEKKFAVGASTPFLVIQAQRDLATAGGNEVTAEAAYVQARLQLDVATGKVLDTYNIEIDEAKRGSVARPPNTLPVVQNK